MDRQNALPRSLEERAALMHDMHKIGEVRVQVLFYV